MKRIVDQKTGKEVVICGAIKKDGELCMARPIRGTGRCRFHGGKSVSGPDHPNFKTGKYSKVLRRDLLRAYADSMMTEDPYSMREELGLLDARLTLLAQGLNNDDGEGLGEKINDLRDLVLMSKSEGDPIDLAILADKVTELHTLVTAERRQWSEIYDVIDYRRKLVESERKREVEAQRMISEQQALIIISLLVNIIRKHVQDQRVLNTISAELNGLTDWKAGRFIES